MVDDFIDFIMMGGDDLINGQKCPSCGKLINPEDADGKSKCPFCGESLD
jgi:predicted RNA-binding Zn-ribbon protein involved in translation (DUF1610 family)